MGHVPVSGKFERVAMDLLDVSVISGKGHKYILVVCDYFTKYTEAYPLADKTTRSVADALMDKWLHIRQTVFTIDWTIQDSARTHGMGGGNTGGR